MSQLVYECFPGLSNGGIFTQALKWPLVLKLNIWLRIRLWLLQAIQPHESFFGFQMMKHTEGRIVKII